MTVDARADLLATLRANRRRQIQLYGAPLGDRVRRLTGALGISQARLARTLGVSPAMLSQLVTARRVKIGDPAVLARLRVLDERVTQWSRAERAAGGARPAQAAVAALLAEVERLRWGWPQLPDGDPRPVRAAVALRGVVEPARLAAAAALLGPGFPELAQVLRLAAHGGPRRGVVGDDAGGGGW